MDNASSFTDERSFSTMCKIFQPKPTDFEAFLPWACKEYCIETDVFVTRAVQKTYVSHVDTKKKTAHKTRRKPSVVPTISDSEDVLDSSLNEMAVTSNTNKIVVETFYNDSENLVQLKLLKNKDLPRRFMQIMALTLPYQKYLTSITINSGLCMESLYEISNFLPNSTITDLCLDNTFISQANYHTLLTNSKLKHLSLAKCMINDAVVQMIADQLKYPCPASRILSALNLSSNRITDVGAKYIADMLRTNRKLSYLNVAGNMITDEGGMRILEILHEFPLHTQELLESKARYVGYLKKRKALRDTYIIELQTEALNKNLNKKKLLKRGKLESQYLQDLPSQKTHRDSDDPHLIEEKAASLAAITMGLFIDPFSQNNIKSQDDVVHCIGNNTLCYLNVAYNNLTYNSLKKLHEVLSIQKSLNRTPRGLIKVVIEGNLMPVACKIYREIDQLLNSHVGDILKESAPPLKRKISTRPSTK